MPNLLLLKDQQAQYDALHQQWLVEQRAAGVKRKTRPVQPYPQYTAPQAFEPVPTFESWNQQRDRELHKPYSWMCG